MFTKGFNSCVYDGDTIHCTVDGFDLTATIHRDDNSGPPDKEDEGFWPSLDPEAAGYIGPDQTEEDLAEAQKKAQSIMDAWRDDEWWYVGVAVTVAKNGIELTGEYNHALWGIDCNHPYGDNAYLMQVANEHVEEALEDARKKVAGLAEAQPKTSLRVTVWTLASDTDDATSAQVFGTEKAAYAEYIESIFHYGDTGDKEIAEMREKLCIEAHAALADGDIQTVEIKANAYIEFLRGDFIDTFVVQQHEVEVPAENVFTGGAQ